MNPAPGKTGQGRSRQHKAARGRIQAVVTVHRCARRGVQYGRAGMGQNTVFEGKFHDQQQRDIALLEGRSFGNRGRLDGCGRQIFGY